MRCRQFEKVTGYITLSQLRFTLLNVPGMIVCFLPKAYLMSYFQQHKRESENLTTTESSEHCDTLESSKWYHCPSSLFFAQAVSVKYKINTSASFLKQHPKLSNHFHVCKIILTVATSHSTIVIRHRDQIVQCWTMIVVYHILLHV